MSACTIALALGCVLEPEEEATEPRVAHGTATDELDKSVFALAKLVDGAARPHCTAWSVKTRRCMATAAHCLNDVPLADLRVFQGKKVFDFTAPNTYTLVAGAKRADLHAAEVRPDWQTRWSDIGVFWLKKGEGAQAIGDYEPIALVDKAPLTAVEWNPVLSSKGTLKSPDGPKEVGLIGYGNDVGGIGAGTRRKGKANAVAYCVGADNTPGHAGSMYKVIPDATAKQMTCGGDSGSPLLHEGKAVAILSATTTIGVCEVEDPIILGQDYFSGIAGDEKKSGSEPSNREWLDKAIERTCSDKIEADIKPRGSKPGKVKGKLLPAPTYPEGDPRDGDILCGDDPGEYDCSERMPADAGLTLTAAANAGWLFDAWESMPGDDACPCEGSASPSCPISEADVGAVGTVGCRARFVTSPCPGGQVPVCSDAAPISVCVCEVVLETDGDTGSEAGSTADGGTGGLDTGGGVTGEDTGLDTGGGVTGEDTGGPGGDVTGGPGGDVTGDPDSDGSGGDVTGGSTGIAVTDGPDTGASSGLATGDWTGDWTGTGWWSSSGDDSSADATDSTGVNLDMGALPDLGGGGDECTMCHTAEQQVFAPMAFDLLAPMLVHP